MEEGVEDLSVARGGLIYVPNFVGPLTCIPRFEAAVLYQLENLDRELSCISPDQCSDDCDVSVDELRIFSEEELVHMALKEAFNDDKNANDSRVENEDGSACCQRDSEEQSRQGSESDNAMAKNNKNLGKRKRKKTDNHAVDEAYLLKVEELVKIKQKQNQDKAAVRLHCFNDSCNLGGNAKPSQDNGRMQSLRSTHYTKQLKISDAQAVQLPEIVLCLEVYHNIRRWVKTQEFLVLGRQTLAEIRDKIYCLTDQVMRLKAGQQDPFGYFLVEDVFCNDLRHPSAIDYSEPIFDWLRNSKDEALRKWDSILGGELQGKHKAMLGEVDVPLPQFKRVEMHKTRFCDLKFRLGAGYLYCHQGDCKHTIVVRDMRLIHPDDIQNRTAYPVVSFQLKSRLEKCNVCNIYIATKVTVDDKWVPYNPCYFCNDCYYLLHHSEDGSLLYCDFSVYDYVHD